MLDESICDFSGVRSMLLLLFYFLVENPVSRHTSLALKLRAVCRKWDIDIAFPVLVYKTSVFCDGCTEWAKQPAKFMLLVLFPCFKTL